VSLSFLFALCVINQSGIARLWSISMDMHTNWTQKHRLMLETTMEKPVAKDSRTMFKSSQLAILPAMNDILWSIATVKRIILVKEMERYLQLMKSLPPLVTVVVWDVINDRIDESTIK